jgi:hypothetical protein
MINLLRKNLVIFVLAMTSISFVIAKPAVEEYRSKTPVSGLSSGLPSVKIHSNSQAIQQHLPVTFGQIFKVGAVKVGQAVAGQLKDGSLIATQLDVKSTHGDGSVRHAVVSLILPHLSADQTEAIQFVTTSKVTSNTPAPVPSLTSQQVIESGFTSQLQLIVDGVAYHASPDAALKAGHANVWLQGPLVTEWQISTPLINDKGEPHPHLHARFGIRASEGAKDSNITNTTTPAKPTIRTEVVVENDWAYEPGPKNITYSVNFQLNGKEVYARSALTHYHHARWRQVFWTPGPPQIDVLHDTAYLIASQAVPNYDQSIKVAESLLSDLKKGWIGTKTEPMGIGVATAYMPTTGGRPDIGILPGWSVAYLLSMDPRAKVTTLGTADLAGSWSIHYRDHATNRPLSVIDHPYAAVLGHAGDHANPATKQSDAFPECSGDCKTPYQADTAHQPSLAYLPYLLTGDYYYLEELQFWAMYDAIYFIAAYRDGAKGLVKSAQIRGQAWMMRSFAQAAYITPDKDPLKSHFTQLVANNLSWFNATYTNNPKANKLGIIVNGYAMEYDQHTGIAPWQDDFFTQAIGHALDLGFEEARPLLKWKSTFPIERMIDPGYCWIFGAAYSLRVRENPHADFYTKLSDAYQATTPTQSKDLQCGSAEMGASLKLSPGEMTGYSKSNVGIPSIMQGALAYSADVGGSAGAKAWRIFNQRTVKPDYSTSPQFAILPRRLN